MRTAYRKILRDLWRNKSRTLLVILSIAVGVMAVGMITSSNRILKRQMYLAHTGSNPAHAWLYLNGSVDDGLVNSLASVPGVEQIEGFAGVGIRWKPSLDSEWEDASLIAVDDFREPVFDVITLSAGRWPGAKSAAVEAKHVLPYGIPEPGGTIYFEVNDRARPIGISGHVRDPFQFPPPFGTDAAFFVSRAEMLRLTGFGDYNRLRFSIPEYSEEQVELVADAIDQKLQKVGVSVGFVQVLHPERHFIQETVDGVGLVLTVMAFSSLFLSVILVINTINALVAQQIPQIGIMKSIGGIRRQIAQLYLSGVLIYGLVSLLLAVPIGAVAGYVLADWMLGLLNVPSSPFEILSQTLQLQIGAGLVVPLLAASWPIIQGVAVPVREALSAYGLGSGRYGASLLDRLMARISRLPRIAILALRNTFRRAGRVALTEIVLITAGAIFMMVVSTHYSFTSTIDDIWRGLGFDALVVFESPQRISEIVPQIESRPNIDLVEMWVWHTGSARVPGDDEPGSERRVFLRGIPRGSKLYSPNLVDGRGLDERDDHAILLNQKLAAELELGVGDQVEIDLNENRKSNWTIIGLVFDLTGNQASAYMHIDVLNRELNSVGRASVAEIRALDGSRSGQLAVVADLQGYFQTTGQDIGFAQSAIEDREQAEAQFSILTRILLVMTVVIALVGSIGLSGTLSINVIERRREIGVMRAVGASSLDVAVIFMGEGLLLGLLSWLQAIPISILFGRTFVVTIGEIIDFPAQYQLSIQGIWVWLAIVFILSMVASWLPARRATRISVNESLAYE